MTRKMEIAEAFTAGGKMHFIVEVNEYDKQGERIVQHSRTPFEFAKGTDVEDAKEEMRQAMAGYMEEPKKAPRVKRLTDLEGTTL